MNIGIFDSGSGGRFVAAKLKKLLPEHHYRVVDDRQNAPYGERSCQEIEQLTHSAIGPLTKTCDMIIIACNTATAAAIDSLRAAHPNTVFVGFEPMIKPASEQSISRRITLLATKATGQSSRTKQLIKSFGSDLTIDVSNTIGWASAIDRQATAAIDLAEIETSVKNGSDIIIIGCTHYIDLMPRLKKIFPSQKILEPSEAIARRIIQLAS